MKAQNTNVYFFYFPVDTLGYMTTAVMSRECKLVTHRLFTSEERVRLLIYESAHVMRMFTSHS